ncbi:MAG: hypothetical protein QXK76_02020 [Candidatus Woesearchaeota archaeon]
MLEKKLEEICIKLDEEAEHVRNPNWISMTQETISTLNNIIKQEERLGNIRKGQKVLDLGSGNGTAAFTWSNNNYKVIGIEIDIKLYNIAVNALKKYPELKQLDVKFFNGSFYPLEYKKTDKTINLESKLLKELSLRNVSNNYTPYFIPFKDTIYNDNNINIKEIDIFYAYVWSFQMPSIFEMFEQLARNDAKLIIIGPSRDSILEKYNNLERKYNTIRKK